MPNCSVKLATIEANQMIPTPQTSGFFMGEMSPVLFPDRKIALH
jgi:hypothetical protein